MLHHELEDVAALVASETVIELPIRGDLEAGRLLVVEWATADPVLALVLQIDSPADEFDQIDAAADLLDGLGRIVQRPGPPRRAPS